MTFATIYMFTWGAVSTGGLLWYYAKYQRAADAVAYMVEAEIEES